MGHAKATGHMHMQSSPTQRERKRRKRIVPWPRSRGCPRTTARVRLSILLFLRRARITDLLVWRGRRLLRRWSSYDAPTPTRASAAGPEPERHRRGDNLVYMAMVSTESLWLCPGAPSHRWWTAVDWWCSVGARCTLVRGCMAGCPRVAIPVPAPRRRERCTRGAP